MKRKLIVASLVWIFIPIAIVSCTSIDKEKTVIRSVASDEIKFESRSGAVFKKPYFLLSESVRLFHADGDSAVGLCRHFGYKNATSYSAAVSDGYEVTWFGKDGTFSISEQRGGFYSIQDLSCE